MLDVTLLNPNVEKVFPDKMANTALSPSWSNASMGMSTCEEKEPTGVFSSMLRV
jgi:hypothetical protein